MMNDKYKVIIRNMDAKSSLSILEYFFLLKKYINSDDLIYGVLQVSYSTFYKFNQNAKKGIVTEGKLLKKLYRLYNYTLYGVWVE